MSADYLDQLARQLKVNKSPACRRAINRILAEMRQRSEAGEYANPTETEAAFRKLVEEEALCHKPAKAKGAAGQ